MDQRSGVSWISGWSKIIAFCQRNSWFTLWVTRREDCFSTEQKSSRIPSSRRRVSLEEQKAQKEDRFLRGRQIAYLIYEYFRVTGANDCGENYADLFTFVVRKWWYSGIRFKIGRNLIINDAKPIWWHLGKLVQLRIRESEKLKTVLELYNMEIHQKKAGPDYHRLKTMFGTDDIQEFDSK